MKFLVTLFSPFPFSSCAYYQLFGVPWTIITGSGLDDLHLWELRLQLQLIRTAHIQWLCQTRFHSLLDYERLHFHWNRLLSDLRVGQLFIFHSPLVNTPQLNTELSYDWTTAESVSESLNDWRFTANQFVLAPSPLRLTARLFVFLNWSPAVIVLI
jgi:hypothetical protein